MTTNFQKYLQNAIKDNEQTIERLKETNGVYSRLDTAIDLNPEVKAGIKAYEELQGAITQA